MAQVPITLNNRTYRLACNDGEEKRLAALAQDVKSRVEKLAREFGQPADERLLLMAAVLLADELWDLREAYDAMLAAAADVLREAAQDQVSAPEQPAVLPSKAQSRAPGQASNLPQSQIHQRVASPPPLPQANSGSDGKIERNGDGRGKQGSDGPQQMGAGTSGAGIAGPATPVADPLARGKSSAA